MGWGMHDVMKRLEIQNLKRARLTDEQISIVTEVPVRSVQRIAAEPGVERLRDPMDLAKSRGVGRPSKVDEFRKIVETILRGEPELKTVEILHRARHVDTTAESRPSTTSLPHRPPSATGPARPVRGSAGRVHPARLRAGGRALPRRHGTSGSTSSPRGSSTRGGSGDLVEDERVESLVRAAPSVVRVVRRCPARRGVRQPEDDRDPQGREPDRVEHDVRAGRCSTTASPPSCARRRAGTRRARSRTWSGG